MLHSLIVVLILQFIQSL